MVAQIAGEEDATLLAAEVHVEQDAGRAGNMPRIEERDAHAGRHDGRHVVLYRPGVPQHGLDLLPEALVAQRDLQVSRRAAEPIAQFPHRAGGLFAGCRGDFLAVAAGAPVNRKRLRSRSARSRDGFAQVQRRTVSRSRAQQRPQHGRRNGRGGLGQVDGPGEFPLDQQWQPAEMIGMGMGQKHGRCRFHARRQALGNARL